MKKLGIFLGALLIGAAGLAVAQTIIVPKVQSVGPTDLFQDIVGGAPSAQNQYATAAQIAGVPGYQNLGTITTGNTFAVNNNVTDVFAQAAGTLAAVTLTAPSAPADGQRVCWLVNQITTALTFSANTGQTVSGGSVSTLAINTPACWTYTASSATWWRSP